MYRNAYQRGLLTVFYSGGSHPLNIWEVHTKDGYISRFLDQELKSMVLEIGGTNVTTSYMICPKGKTVLGITMPFLVMVVKNLKKYFSFEVTILDETPARRRFRVSNFQSTTQIMPLCTVMPIALSDGWNQIQFNLAEFTRRAYKKQFIEVQKIKINANIRVRRIYFAERLLTDEELPPEYKLFFPLPSKGAKDKKTATQENKENIKLSASQQAVTPVDAIPDEQKAPSEAKLEKASLKASAHSMKKASSHESKKTSKTNVESIPEGETHTAEQDHRKTTVGEPAIEAPTGEDATPEEVTESPEQPAEQIADTSEDTPAPAEAQAAES